MPSVRRNVCARRSRPANARGFLAHAVALEMSSRALFAHKRKKSDALPLHVDIRNFSRGLREQWG
jgi:hypothetical protein